MNNSDASKSKCWGCKFGLCVQESELEYIYHNGIEGELEIDDPFNMEDILEKQEPLQHKIEHERIKAICYWRPEGINDTPPILVSHVSQCNRFKKL